MKGTARIFWAAVCLALGLVARTIHVQNSLDYELVCAAKRLDGLAVKTCLAKGANPNATDTESCDPLWWRALAHLTRQQPGLAYDGDTALLVVLKGCVDRYNAKATNLAPEVPAPASVEPAEIVNALLNNGAAANCTFVYGDSAFAYAQGSGYKRCVRMLLEHGARANGIAFGGGTLLTYAISADDFDTVSELVKHGANVTATGTSGASPLAVATSSSSSNYPARRRIIKFLTESGARR